MTLRILIAAAAGAFLAWLITFAVYESTRPITLPAVASPLESVSPAPQRPAPERSTVGAAHMGPHPLVGVWREAGTSRPVYRVGTLPFSETPVVAPASGSDVLIGPTRVDGARLAFAQTLRLKDAEGNVLGVFVVEAEARIDPDDEDALLVTLRRAGSDRAHEIRFIRDRSARAAALEPEAT